MTCSSELFPQSQVPAHVVPAVRDVHQQWFPSPSLPGPKETLPFLKNNGSRLRINPRPKEEHEVDETEALLDHRHELMVQLFSTAVCDDPARAAGDSWWISAEPVWHLSAATPSQGQGISLCAPHKHKVNVAVASGSCMLGPSLEGT